MKKLGSMEQPEDFILAIAGGADINDTYNGMPLVRYFFSSLMHLYELSNETHRGWLRKFQALITAEADVSSVIYGEPGSYDSFYYLARGLSLQLQLLDSLLESDQARELILGDSWYHAALMECHEALAQVKAHLDELENL